MIGILLAGFDSKKQIPSLFSCSAARNFEEKVAKFY
jgi:hypothetical protein